MAPLTSNIEQISHQLDVHARVSGRDSADVRILAAVKYLDDDGCRELLRAGVDQLAENRLDRLAERQDALAAPAALAAPPAADATPPATWHFIGRLQSRQAADVAARVAMVHTLCTDSAARRLARAADDGLALPELLVQVNVAADPAKDGIAPANVPAFLDDLPAAVRVAGFMTMPAAAECAEDSRAAFAALRELRDRLAPQHAGRHELHHLSMGTSQDWTVAVEEGATLVRLGRILYAGAE